MTIWTLLQGGLGGSRQYYRGYDDIDIIIVGFYDINIIIGGSDVIIDEIHWKFLYDVFTYLEAF